MSPSTDISRIEDIIFQIKKWTGLTVLGYHPLSDSDLSLHFPHTFIIKAHSTKHTKVMVSLADDLHAYLKREGEDYPAHIFHTFLTSSIDYLESQSQSTGINSIVDKPYYQYLPLALWHIHLQNVASTGFRITTSAGTFDLQAISGYREEFLEAENLITNTLIHKIGDEIQERRAKELELKKANEEIRQLLSEVQNTSYVRSRFLANMSHELRTPMNGILGFLDLLEMRNKDPEQVEFLRIIRRSSQDLLSLLNNILDFSKLDAGQMKLENLPFNVESLIHDTCETIQGRNHNSLPILSDIPLFGNQLNGDAMRIKQILLNLLGNAAKFTEDGHIAVRVHYNAQNQLLIRIEDTGVGISQDKISRIFDEFEQEDVSTTRRFGGSGLGLAICKRLSELMNGSIEATSTLNKGSCFQISLPLSVSDTKIDIKIPDCSHQKVHLLLSDPTEKEIIGRMLDETGVRMSSSAELPENFESGTLLIADAGLIPKSESLLDLPPATLVLCNSMEYMKEAPSERKHILRPLSRKVLHQFLSAKPSPADLSS